MGLLTPDPLSCARHWDPSPRLSAWGTQKRRSGGEQLATLCRFERYRNRTLNLPHRQPVRLTNELTTGTVPEIEPKTSRADSDVFNPYTSTGRFGKLKIMTSQAEHLPALQPFSSEMPSVLKPVKRCFVQL